MTNDKFAAAVMAAANVAGTVAATVSSTDTKEQMAVRLFAKCLQTAIENDKANQGGFAH